MTTHRTAQRATRQAGQLGVGAAAPVRERAPPQRRRARRSTGCASSSPTPTRSRAARSATRCGRDGGFVVSAEAKDGARGGRARRRTTGPSCVLMEVALPGVDGIGACREITTRAPEVRVVMFSVPQEREVEMRALRAGAGGLPLQEREHRVGRARAALGRRRRGGGHALADLAPGRAAALDGRERDRHAAGQEPADDARVGGARPDLRRRLDARDLGEAVPLRGHRLQPHEEHPAQARRALAHRRRRARGAAAPAAARAERARAAGRPTARAAIHCAPMRVGIVGLGYVGLPLAVAFARRRRRGPRRRRRRRARSRRSRPAAPTSRTSPTTALARGARAAARVGATTRALADCDAILICVPTPLTANREPDLGAAARRAPRRSARIVRAGPAVVLESTTYPGTTRERSRRCSSAAGCAPASTSTSRSRPSASTPGAPTSRSPTRRRSSAG